MSIDRRLGMLDWRLPKASPALPRFDPRKLTVDEAARYAVIAEKLIAAGAKVEGALTAEECEFVATIRERMDGND